eukprot:scaffold8733_cov114-Isochrysis_galbana.AAC.8
MARAITGVGGDRRPPDIRVGQGDSSGVARVSEATVPRLGSGVRRLCSSPALSAAFATRRRGRLAVVGVLVGECLVGSRVR